MKQDRQLLLRLEDAQKMEHQRVEHFIRQGVALLDEDPDHQAVGAGVGHFAEEEEGGGGVEDWDGDFGDDGGDDDGFF